jgi:CRP-like cAMP-binding protein
MSPMTNSVSAPRERVRQTDNVGPDDVDSQWLDDMVKRLFRELNRQMCQLENLKEGTSTGPDRAANARTLDSLERTLERLARMEREREALRQKKVARKNDEAREALIRRLDQLLAQGRAPKLPE